MCRDGVPTDACLVRILLGDRVFEPSGNPVSVFDTVDDSGPAGTYAPESIVRSLGEVGPGTHTIKVQAAATRRGDADVTFQLNDIGLVAYATAA
jgi:hypothetical protein